MYLLRFYDNDETKRRNHNILKAQKLKINWFDNHGVKYQPSSLVKNNLSYYNEKSRKHRAVLEELNRPDRPVLPVINYPKKEESQHTKERRLHYKMKHLYEGSSKWLNITEMKKPCNKTLEHLYEGVSREQEGRHEYLKQRKELTSEQKWNQPVTSSMDIGWSLGDCYRRTKHARKSAVRTGFFRKNGVFRPMTEEGLTAVM